jgi:hypothetical protein
MGEQTEQIFLESLGRVLHASARILPGVLAMLLIVALALALALVLRALVRRSLEQLGADRRLREWGLAAPHAEGRVAPSRLVARVVAWTVIAFGFLAGLAALDVATTNVLALRAMELLPRLLVSLAVFVVGLASSRAVERSVLIGAVNMGFHSARLLGVAARWLVVILAIAIALDTAGVGGRVVPVALGILFGGIVLAIALAVGLGARDVVARSLSRHFPSGPQRLDDRPPGEDRVQHL